MNADTLAKRSGKGDRGAFGELYELFAKRIYAYLYYRCLSRETAEDLTSAVFVKTLEAIGDFSPGPGGFSAWIYAIARNALMDHYRGNSRVEAFGDLASGVWDLRDPGDLEMEAAERDRWERLKPYLAELPSEQREVLIMRIWDELPYREIARLTSRSEASCKMAYSRALARLRDAMPLALFIVFLWDRAGSA